MVLIFPALGERADDEPALEQGEAHRLLEVPEVGVGLVAIAADRDEFAGLVSGDEDGAVQLVEEFGQSGGVDAAEFGGGVGCGRAGVLGGGRFVGHGGGSVGGSGRRRRPRGRGYDTGCIRISPPFTAGSNPP